MQQLHVQNCHHPVEITTWRGKQMVACGKCDHCRMSRANSWVARLEQERQCWPYALFITLTYDNECLPRLSVRYDSRESEKEDILILENNETVRLKNTQRGRRETTRNDYFEVPVGDLEGDSFRFLSNNRNVPYVPVSDVSRFMKRFRKNVSDLHNKNIDKLEKYGIKQKDINRAKIVRYFICTEYGPTTLRPHLHGLLFFSSRLTAAHCKEILVRSWPFGEWKSGKNCTAEYVRSTAPSYVAHYLNCFSYLPKILTYKGLRPRIFCSKSPAIGTMQVSDEEIWKLFDTSACRRTVADARRKAFVDVPLYKCLSDRLFPRISGYDAFDCVDRDRIYSTPQTIGFDDFDDFQDWVTQCVQSSGRGLFYTYYSFLTDGYRNLKPLRRHYYQIRRVFEQSSVFGCSISDYVAHIDRYLKNSRLAALRDFYTALEDLPRDTPTYRRLLYYGEFTRTLPNHFSDLTPFQKGVLQFYQCPKEIYENQTAYFNFTSELIPEASVEFNGMVEEDKIKLAFSMKNKKKNDYLLAHPEYLSYKFGY